MHSATTFSPLGIGAIKFIRQAAKYLQHGTFRGVDKRSLGNLCGLIQQRFGLAHRYLGFDVATLPNRLFSRIPFSFNSVEPT